MQNRLRCLTAATASAILCIAWTAVLAQTRPPVQAECQTLRERLLDHTNLSQGVRGQLGAYAARYMAAPQPPARPSRDARLEEIARERQQLDDQRMAAFGRLDFTRAMQLQEQIKALDQEKADLQKQPAAPQPVTPSPAPVQPSSIGAAEIERIPCAEMAGLVNAALKIRRKELGAREDLADVIPLTAIKQAYRDEIARALAAQFDPWPQAATQVGLLDQSGDGRLDAFVDVPVRDLFRLYRQLPDGTVRIEFFPIPGRATDTEYGEMTRRLDEAISRQTGRKLVDLLATRPAGPLRTYAEPADFAATAAHFLAGNFSEAARVVGATARVTEFRNFRGETLRLLEILAPVPGGVMLRRILSLPESNNQETREETTASVRPTSYWATDVELAASRQTFTNAGAPVGPPSVASPSKFTVER